MHEDSHLMSKSPTSMVVDQVPDSEIAKCSSWLEVFATRSVHSASFSFTSLEAVYNFLQKVIRFLRCFRFAGLPQARRYTHEWPSAVAKSTVWEVPLMSCDAGVTATELYSSTYALESYSLRIALSWPSLASLRWTQGHVVGRSWPFLLGMPIRSKDGRRLWRRNRWKWYLVFSRNVRVEIMPPERRLHPPYVCPNHFHTSILWTLSILLRPKILVNVLQTIFGRTLDPDLLPLLQINLMSRTNSLSLNHLFRPQHPVYKREFC